MRYIFMGLAAALAAAAAIIALAQPAPAPPTAAASAAERKLMPIDWNEVREALRSQRLVRTKFRQMSVATNAPQPSLPILLPIEQRIAAASVSSFPQRDFMPPPCAWAT